MKNFAVLKSLILFTWLATAPDVELSMRANPFRDTKSAIKATFKIPCEDDAWWMIEGPPELLQLALPRAARECKNEQFLWWTSTDGPNPEIEGYGLVQILKSPQRVQRPLVTVSVIWRPYDPTLENFDRVEALAKLCRAKRIDKPEYSMESMPP